MHLQENSIFDLWPWPWGQGHTKCCPVPSTSCDLFSYKVWSCYVSPLRMRYNYKKIQYLTLTLGSRSHKMLPSTLYIMWPFQLQSLKLLRLTVKKEIQLQENTIFDLWPWPWGQGHTKCCPVPSTSCDLFNYKVWSCYLLRFRRRYIYKKRDGRTDRRTDGRTDRRTDGRRTDFDTKLIYPFFLKKKAGIIIYTKTTCLSYTNSKYFF